ncbi:MAG: VWA domain-containing protein [Candidatus Methanoplasma sp.]|jgi:magnesium chelatase subunit D|nr:VWA domain-containing protein [Candidatus Methanoplasma sp.]
MGEDGVRNGMRPAFPFSAVVGNDLAKKGIVCALSSPDITSALVCGPKGSGKSVLARSISAISGDRRLITLPLSATEDQIFGGIDLEKTMRDGTKALSDSVLVRSDGNILLAENANLLPEAVLHQVLNAAGTGFNTVEREGVSETHDCRFLLVATMDAEEGGLSEHILDRFDVCVFMSAMEDESLRAEVVSRRLAFEADPEGFASRYGERDSRLAAEIARARSAARFTRVPPGYCGAISEVCNDLNVAGHRGDISVMNAACAIAALDGRDVANLEDLKAAASICLEHRRNDQDRSDQPPPPPPREQEREERDDDREDDREDDKGDDMGGEGDADRSDPPEDSPPPDAPPPPPPPDDGELREEVFSVGESFKIIDYMPGADKAPRACKSGRRSKADSEDRSGRCIGFRIPRGKVRDIALCASIRAASPYQLARDHGEMAVVLEPDDLREKVREKRQGSSILFLVDGSGSIGAQKRMVAVKGAILSMLKDAYQKRDEIGMAVFRMDKAEEILPITRSVLKAYKVLAEIPTGGRTPLIHGLIKGHEMLREKITRESAPVMVVISDGKCNVPYTPGAKPIDEMLSTARSMSGSGVRFIVIDTETGSLRFGLALELCRALNGTYLCLEDLNAEYIESSVRAAMRDA